MLDTQQLARVVADAIAGTDIFVVSVQVSPANDAVVLLDSPSDLDIDTCANITRAIEQAFDRDDTAVGDYSLEVGSAGLTAPFTVMGQWLKNVGKSVEVLTADGRKLRGSLAAVDPQAQTFTLEYTVRQRPEGAKRPISVLQQLTLPMADARRACPVIDFK